MICICPQMSDGPAIPLSYWPVLKASCGVHHVHRYQLPSPPFIEGESKRDEKLNLWILGVCACKAEKWHLGAFDGLLSIHEQGWGQQAIAPSEATVVR